jgi:hypothetical protein
MNRKIWKRIIVSCLMHMREGLNHVYFILHTWKTNINKINNKTKINFLFCISMLYMQFRIEFDLQTFAEGLLP